jgi:hypothetical protein
MHFPHTEGVEVMVKEADDHIGTLSTDGSFIYQIINLLGETFCMDTEHQALPWNQKIYRAWLHWVARIGHLLSKIKRIMQCTIKSVGSMPLHRNKVVLLGGQLSFGTHGVVDSTLFTGSQQVFLLVLENS